MDLENQKAFNKFTQPFWITSAPSNSYPELTNDLKVDIAVVGGGMTGILCAYLLSKENRQLAVIEANCILHGTTGHTTAKVTSQHGLIYDKIKSKISSELAQQYANANETAIRTLERIISDNKIDCDFVPQLPPRCRPSGDRYGRRRAAGC